MNWGGGEGLLSAEILERRVTANGGGSEATALVQSGVKALRREDEGET